MDLLSVVPNPKAIEAQDGIAALWEQFLEILPLVLIGPIPRALSLVAIAVAALMLYLDSHRQIPEKAVRGRAGTNSRKNRDHSNGPGR